MPAHAHISSRASSTPTRRSPSPAAPSTRSVWRRAFLFVCPHLDEQGGTTKVNERLSGAPPTHQQRLPASERGTRPASSRKKPRRLSSSAAFFERELDTRFLSPTGKLLLQRLKRLGSKTDTTMKVLVQSGAEAFWMRAADVDVLCQLQAVTERPTVGEKRALIGDLWHLVRPTDRFALERALLGDARVKCQEAEDARASGGVESLLDLYSDGEDDDGDVDESALIPASLVMTKAGRGTLSPLTEFEEPGTVNATASQRRIGQRSPSLTGRKQQGSVGNARAGLMRNHGEDAKKPLRCGTGPGRFHANETRAQLQSPGSVRRGRLAADYARDESLDTASSLSSREPMSISPWTSEDSLPHPLTSRNSISRTFHQSTLVISDDTFLSPREAPQPVLRQSSSTSTGSLQPQGSVSKGRTAAVKAPHTNSNLYIQPRPSLDSCSSSKQSGSVRNALATLPQRVEEVSISPLRPGREPRYAPGSARLPQYRAIQRDWRPQGQGFSKYPFFGAPRWGSPKKTLVAPERSDGAAALRASGEHTQEMPHSPSTSGHPAVRPSPSHLLGARGSLDRSNAAYDILVSNGRPSGLRGGGGDEETQQARRRVPTIFGRVTRLEDEERPPAALWYLAGGRVGRNRKVPIAGELRARRRVEEANRDQVGFWGTVLGSRTVRRLPVSEPHGESGDDAGNDAGDDPGDDAREEVAEAEPPRNEDDTMKGGNVGDDDQEQPKVLMDGK